MQVIFNYIMTILTTTPQQQSKHLLWVNRTWQQKWTANDRRDLEHTLGHTSVLIPLLHPRSIRCPSNPSKIWKDLKDVWLTWQDFICKSIQIKSCQFFLGHPGFLIMLLRFQFIASFGILQLFNYFVTGIQKYYRTVKCQQQCFVHSCITGIHRKKNSSAKWQSVAYGQVESGWKSTMALRYGPNYIQHCCCQQKPAGFYEQNDHRFTAIIQLNLC